MWTGERRTVAIIGLGQATAILFGILACSTACKGIFGGGTAPARFLRDHGWCLLVIPLAWTTAVGLWCRRGLLETKAGIALTVTGILLVVAIGIVMGLPLARVLLGHGQL